MNSVRNIKQKSYFGKKWLENCLKVIVPGLIPGIIAAFLVVLLQPYVAMVVSGLDTYPPTIKKYDQGSDKIIFEVRDTGSFGNSWQYEISKVWDQYGKVVNVRSFENKNADIGTITLELMEPRNNRTFYYELYVYDHNYNQVTYQGEWKEKE